MKDIFCVYRDWDYGSFDIIAFETRKEAEELSFKQTENDWQEFDYGEWITEKIEEA